MLILFFLGLVFAWLAIREIRQARRFDSFSFIYVAITLVLAVLCCKPAVDHWRFEQFLTTQAFELTEHRPTEVNCVTVFQSVFDRFGLAGVAYPETGEIILQYPTCNQLRDYLDSPDINNLDGVFSVHVFTHEAMHARGEYNEHKTDCQAIQRDYRAGKLLGLSDENAKQTALTFYRGAYKRHPYFSKDCAPKKALDERLVDSTWNWLEE